MSASATTGRTPERPIDSVRARSSIVARTTSSSTGGPTPAAAELGLVCAHVTRDLSRVRPGVCPQRPTDGLANEEVAIGKIRRDGRIEQLKVRVLLERDLADDRNATLPEIFVAAPRTHDGSHLPGMSAEHLSDKMCGLVDMVPPGASDDHLLEHGHHARRAVFQIALLARELHGRVSLLAKLRATPQIQHLRLPLVARRERVFRESALADRADPWHADPAVRHRRFHVSLHPRRPGWVGGGGERGLNLSSQFLRPARARREAAQGAGMKRAWASLPSSTSTTHVEPFS